MINSAMDQYPILSSEAAPASSTPPRAISDGAIQPSSSPSSQTPPSSPPVVLLTARDHIPIAKISSPTRPKNAFSILGKRRALTPLNDNERRPSKTRVLTTNLGGGSSTTTTTTSPAPRPSDRPALTQMQLSYGQQTQKRCATCGMEYVPSSAEDRALHDRFHRQNAEGYVVGREFAARLREEQPAAVWDGVAPDDAVCAVRAGDKRGRRKHALGVLQVVQRELGAVEIAEEDLWAGSGPGGGREGGGADGRFAAYLYVRDGKCIGFLLAERIRSARRVETPVTALGARRETAEGREERKSALSALKARQQAQLEAARAPLQLSVQAHRACLGISRIWTSPSHRGQNIAMRLLDVAFADAKLRGNGALTKDLVAFSHPTEAGRRLARRWFGRLWEWSVYVD